MIEVKLQFDDVNALIKFFGDKQITQTIAPAVINPPTTPPAVETKRRGRPPKTEQAQPTVANNGGSASPETTQGNSPADGAPQGDGAGAPAGDSSPAAPVTLTVDDAKQAGLKVTDKFGAVEGMNKVREVCAKLGVKLIRDLKGDQIKAFIDECVTLVTA